MISEHFGYGHVVLAAFLSVNSSHFTFDVNSHSIWSAHWIARNFTTDILLFLSNSLY